jgi:multiple sugar transport system permease protein
MSAAAPPGQLRGSRFGPSIVAVGFAYATLPLVWLLISSTKSDSALFSTFGFFFADEFNLIDNLQRTVTHNGGIFVRWMLNTALYAGVSALVATALAAMCGYGLAKYQFRGRELIFAGIIGAVMIPTTALVIPLFLMFSDWGLTNTAWAFILPSIVNPFGVFLARVFATTSIPDELIDAARVDGAGEFRIFLSVGVRLMSPGLITVLLFTLVTSWNNYFLPLVMFSSPERFPVTVGLANWSAAAATGTGGQLLFSLVITGSVLAIIPLVVAFLVLQRFWVGGLTLGAVK